MLTHSGIPKPQYYALKMLVELGENRLEMGEGRTDGKIGVAAFTGNGTLQVLLFRQKMKNLPLPKEKATVRIRLEREPKEVWLVRIDEEHGNPLRLWEEWGSPEDLKPEEREALIRQTRVEKEETEYSYQEGELVLAAELGVNDIYFYTIVL